ncbi:MAG TPA: divalent metal cation transporter [Chthoniobacterales bacterium]|nr:divalent metal cation transporter [Chthoniobacterales bacterium]
MITGAADDDPSGIATYSSVGAQFGYGMLWTMPFIYPFMAAIQEISARIGRVTGHGIAGNMRLCYPRWLVCLLVALLVFANVINLGADISAMGAAVNLIIGGPSPLYCVLLAGISLLLQIRIPYQRYATVLKWLALSLFAYVATAFVVKIDWSKALWATVAPNVSLSPDYLQALVAVFGTTISPYLFFWQSSEEVEELQSVPSDKALKHAPSQGPDQLRRIKVDTYLGMAVSNLIAYFIILTVAVTLNSHGKTNIDSAAEAAESLRPIAGNFCSSPFQSRHYRDRTFSAPSSCRIQRLCYWGGVALAGGSQTQGKERQSILCRAGSFGSSRAFAEFHRSKSYPRIGLFSHC